MKKCNKKKNKKMMYFIIFMVLYFTVNIVYAATSSKVSFCDYIGVRRTFKIVGIIINLARIIVPLVLIAAAITTMFKTVLSGKTEDLKASFLQISKQAVAGLIIFVLPAVIDFVFDSLVPYDDTGFSQCSNCLLDTDHCVIPDSDPETYTQD